jgi:hypothetical protein
LTLEDAIKRKELFFDDNIPEENEWFPAHAILLLKELKSTESLERIIDFLQFDYEILEGIVHDKIDETIPNILSICSEGRLSSLADVILSEKYSIWLKMALGEAVTIQALRKIISKEEAAQWHLDLMIHYLEYDTVNAETKDLISNLVCDCMDIQAKETLGTIEALFSRGFVNSNWSGTLDEIIDIMESTDHSPFLPENISMIEYYAEQIEFDKEMAYRYALSQPYVRDAPKTGRNDPCPCGSGKKYKKCHGVE